VKKKPEKLNTGQGGKLPGKKGAPYGKKGERAAEKRRSPPAPTKKTTYKTMLHWWEGKGEGQEVGPDVTFAHRQTGQP